MNRDASSLNLRKQGCIIGEVSSWINGEHRRAPAVLFQILDKGGDALHAAQPHGRKIIRHHQDLAVCAVRCIRAGTLRHNTSQYSEFALKGLFTLQAMPEVMCRDARKRQAPRRLYPQCEYQTARTRRCLVLS